MYIENINNFFAAGLNILQTEAPYMLIVVVVAGIFFVRFIITEPMTDEEMKKLQKHKELLKIKKEKEELESDLKILKLREETEKLRSEIKERTSKKGEVDDN